MNKSLLLVLALLIGITGCSRNEPTGGTAKGPVEEMVPLQLSILNYTDHRINNVDVEGSWAGSMSPHNGGSAFAGSTSVPRTWRPDFQLTVRWQDEEEYADPVWRSGGPMREHMKRLSVQPYQQDETGRMAVLWIAFFPDDVVKLYPTFVDPGQPEFPDGLILPTHQCLKDFPDDFNRCVGRASSKDKAMEVAP